MKRTNIYLAEEQASALDMVARARGISRAELIRELIDLGAGAADLESDLSAIGDSFGVLADADVTFSREPDDRARHLGRVASQ